MSQQYEITARPSMQSIDPSLIARQSSMSHALQLCAAMSGLPEKAFVGAGGIVKDSGQWSRIMSSGTANFPQDELNKFMDAAGNEVPLLWLLHSRGYDITYLRKRESEYERQLREANERNAELMKRLEYAESILCRTPSQMHAA